MPKRHDDGVDDGLSEALRPYVEAFRAVERPGNASRSRTWAAVSDQIRPRSGVWPWVAAAAAAAAAAALLLWLRPSTPTPDETADPGPAQAHYGHRGEAETGVSEPVRPAPRGKAVPDAVEAPSTDAVRAAPPAETDVPPPQQARPKRRSKPPTPPRPDPTATDDGPSLAEETALFGEIQRALVDGQTEAALRAIARHEREFPRGAFRLERIVAKARALCDAGRAAEARKLRDDFLRSHARSHLAPRMEEICGD